MRRRKPYRYIPIVTPIYRRVRRVARRFYMNGDNVKCPVCDTTFRRWIHSDVGMCPNCDCKALHRMFWLYINRKFVDRLSKGTRLIHFAPELGLINRFRSILGTNYVTADYSAPGVDINVDLTRLDIEDKAFDVAICFDVLEHIVDDRAAMVELYRILRSGGIAFVSVPWKADRVTDEDPNVTDTEERIRRFGQFDHVRLYGGDVVDRLREAGFDVSVEGPAREFTDSEIARYGLFNRVIFVCRKEGGMVAGSEEGTYVDC